VQHDDLSVEDGFHLDEIVLAGEGLGDRDVAQRFEQLRDGELHRAPRFGRELQVARVFVRHRLADRPRVVVTVVERT
jgi:hypothetical protein